LLQSQNNIVSFQPFNSYLVKKYTPIIAERPQAVIVWSKSTGSDLRVLHTPALTLLLNDLKYLSQVQAFLYIRCCFCIRQKHASS